MAPLVIHRKEYRGMKTEMALTDSEFLLLQLVYNQIDNSVVTPESFVDLPFNIIDALWDFLSCGEDMPYGTQTADDGDPDEWIFAALEDTFHDELTGHHYFEDGQLIVIKEK